LKKYTIYLPIALRSLGWQCWGKSHCQ